MFRHENVPDLKFFWPFFETYFEFDLMRRYRR
jgi:hypothetical protein